MIRLNYKCMVMVLSFELFGQAGLGKQCRPRSDRFWWRSLIRVHTVCHSAFIFCTYYFKAKPHYSNLSHFMRKPAFAICEQQSRRSACAFAQSDQCLYFRCLDSIIPLVSISKISSLYLASVAEQACLSQPWSQNPKDRFSRDKAHLRMTAVI